MGRWAWVSSWLDKLGLEHIVRYFSLAPTLHTPLFVKNTILQVTVHLICRFVMDSSKEEGAALVTRLAEQSERSYGGPAWAMQEFGDLWDTSSVTGEVVEYCPGASKGRDRYVVRWSHGPDEKLKLGQILELLKPLEGKAARLPRNRAI